MPYRCAFRSIWYAVFAALLISTGLFLLSLTVFGPNLGMPFGYYGKLNRIVSALDALPRVDVIDVRMNHDISLEDFSVDVLIDGEHRDSVYFPEADSQPIGNMLLQVERWNQGRFQ